MLGWRKSGLILGEFATLKRSNLQVGEENRGHGRKSKGSTPGPGVARCVSAEASCLGVPCGRWNPWSHLRTSRSGGQPAREIWELLGCILRICEGESRESYVLRTMCREICLAGIGSQVKLSLGVRLTGNFPAARLCYRGCHRHLCECLSPAWGHWILEYVGKFV